MSDIGSLSNMHIEYDDTHPILDVQGESREWRAEAYPETRSIELQALGVCEEAGELAHAVLKYKQGIRGYDREKTAKEVADAIGDIFIYACGVADQLDLNVVDEVVKAWHHVRDRNITQGSDPGMGPIGVGCFPPVENETCARCSKSLTHNGPFDQPRRWIDMEGGTLCDPDGILLHTPVESIKGV